MSQKTQNKNIPDTFFGLGKTGIMRLRDCT